MVTFPDPPDAPDGTFENPHPAVIVQNDSDNAQLQSTIVVPVTTGDDPDPISEVLLTPPDDDVEHPSIVVINQVTTVSIPDQIKDVDGDEEAWKLGQVSADSLREIEEKLAVVMSI